MVPATNPGKYTVAAVESARIQRGWDALTREQYAYQKAQLAHLTGKARKAAKLELAERFGFPTVQYEAPI